MPTAHTSALEKLSGNHTVVSFTCYRFTTVRSAIVKATGAINGYSVTVVADVSEVCMSLLASAGTGVISVGVLAGSEANSSLDSARSAWSTNVNDHVGAFFTPLSAPLSGLHTAIKAPSYDEELRYDTSPY